MLFRSVGLRLADALGMADPAAIVVPDRLSDAYDFLWQGFTARAHPGPSKCDGEELAADELSSVD